jgi:hypothetical protein
MLAPGLAYTGFARKEMLVHNAMWIVMDMCVLVLFYLAREIGTSIVETFLTLPSSD